jgi:hypothetical protein
MVNNGKHQAIETNGVWMHSGTFLKIGSIWRRVVRFTPLPPYTRETASDTHCIGERVNLRAGMDVMEKGNASFPTENRKPSPQSTSL